MSERRIQETAGAFRAGRRAGRASAERERREALRALVRRRASTLKELEKR